MIIDAHVHIFPDNIVQAAVTTLQGTSGLKSPYDGSLNNILRLMQKHGMQYVLNLPVATRPDQVEQINRYLLKLPPSVLSFAAFHPHTENPEYILRQIRENGFQGVKIHPEYQCFQWDSERMQRVCSAAQELDIVLFSHSGWDVSFDNMQSTIAEYASVVRNYPKVRFVAAHFGGYLCWDEVEKQLVSLDNVYFDTSFTLPYLDPKRLKRMAYDHGLEKVFFGTDYPWQSYEKDFYYLSSVFSPSELERIYSGNIMRFLGINDTVGKNSA